MAETGEEQKSKKELYRKIAVIFIVIGIPLFFLGGVLGLIGVVLAGAGIMVFLTNLK